MNFDFKFILFLNLNNNIYKRFILNYQKELIGDWGLGYWILRQEPLPPNLFPSH